MRLRRGSERGLTLVEVMIGIGVAGLVCAGVIGALAQVMQGSRNSEQMGALRQVQGAGYWLSLDAIQATNITEGAGQGFPITIIQVDSTNTTHCIVYSLGDMSSGMLKVLQREEWSGSILTGNSTVAQYLDQTQTSCDWDSNAKVLTCIFTAVVNQKTETRTYKVQPRPFT